MKQILLDLYSRQYQNIYILYPTSTEHFRLRFYKRTYVIDPSNCSVDQRKLEMENSRMYINCCAHSQLLKQSEQLGTSLSFINSFSLIRFRFERPRENSPTRQFILRLSFYKIEVVTAASVKCKVQLSFQTSVGEIWIPSLMYATSLLNLRSHINVRCK